MSLAQAYMIINFDKDEQIEERSSQMVMHGIDPSVLFRENAQQDVKESDFLEIEEISLSVMDSIKERIQNE